MEEIDVLKPLSEEEKQKGVIDVLETKNKTLWHKAKKQYEEHYNASIAKQKPFCQTCALGDFSEAQKAEFKLAPNRQKYGPELRRMGLSYVEKNIPIKVNPAKYSDPAYFRIVQKGSPERETQRINGHQRVNYVTYYDVYQCRKGHKIAIQVKEEIEKPKELK